MYNISYSLPVRAVNPCQYPSVHLPSVFCFRWLFYRLPLITLNSKTQLTSDSSLHRQPFLIPRRRVLFRSASTRPRSLAAAADAAAAGGGGADAAGAWWQNSFGAQRLLLLLILVPIYSTL